MRPDPIDQRSRDQGSRDQRTGDPVATGGCRDRRRDRRRDPRVEGAGHDARLGQVAGDDVGQRLGGGELHPLGDRGGPHVERAAEDAGEGEHVVDLVGVVAAPGGDDRGVPVGDLGVRPRGRVGQREDDRVVGHRGHRLLGHRPAGHADEDVGAGQRVGRACRCDRRCWSPRRALLDVGQVGATGVHDTLAVRHGDVTDAGLLQDPGDRDPAAPAPDTTARRSRQGRGR